MSALPARRERLRETAGAAVAARVAAAPQPALAVWFQGDPTPELWTLDPEAAPADMPGRKADLPASLLHHHLLKTAGVPLTSATEDGDLLPPKSTRFLPKLVSGLVWCGHDAEVVAG